MSEYGALTAKMYDPMLAPFLKAIRKRVVDEAKQVNAKSVIDLCCGTGHQLSFFAKEPEFERIIGVDLSPHMIKQAQKYGVECLLQDATKTQFQDNSFDAAVISFALHEKPFDLAQQIINEAKRIVKPQGVIMVVDYSFDHKAKPYGKFSTWLVEFMVGGEHYRNFRKYLKLGGLKQLCNGLKLVKDIRFISGAVALQICQTPAEIHEKEQDKTLKTQQNG